MSFEKAAAILDAANSANPLTSIPGVDPNTSTLVTKEDHTKDITFDTKTDSLTDPKLEETKEVTAEPQVKKPDEKEEKASQRFALLAKKEKALYQNSQKIKAQEAVIEEKLTALNNYENFKKQVAQNPMLALQELGISYEQLTQYVLTNKMPNSSELEIKSVRDEMAELRKQQEERDKKAEEGRIAGLQARAKQEIAAFQQQIGDYISSNVDKYELINLNEATHLVFQTVENHFEKTKRILSIEEASDIVEKYLEDQVEKNLRAKKLAQRATPQPKKEDTKQVPTAQPRTLTNEMTSSAPSMLPAKTERDRMARAMAALSR